VVNLLVPREDTLWGYARPTLSRKLRDTTPTRVKGKNEVCHVVGNDLFTSYHTRKGASRLDVLAVLWGSEPLFRFTDDSEAWLAQTSVSTRLVSELKKHLPFDRGLERAELEGLLQAAGIELNVPQHQQVYDDLAVAAYHDTATDFL